MTSKLHVLTSFILVSCVSGHNITKILAPFSDYSSFNSLLIQTQLAPVINSQRTITVLVAANSVVSTIAANQPAYVFKRILSLHALLGYYDSSKLSQLENQTDMVHTLFDTSGVATGRNGYLNITGSGGSSIIKSAELGARYDAHVVKVVSSQPYNISVVEISNLIIPPAIGSSHTVAPASAPNGPPSPSTSVANASVPSLPPSAADALNPASEQGETASAATSMVEILRLGVGMGVSAFLVAF